MAALLTLGGTLLRRETWGPHHFAYPLIFFGLACATALSTLRQKSRLFFALAALIILLCQASMWARMSGAELDPCVGADKDRLLAELRQRGLDRETIQVHTSWGTYYLAHLFGDRRQAVFYLRDPVEQRAELDRLAALASRLGRGVLVVSSDPETFSLEPLGRLGPPAARYASGPWEAREYLAAGEPVPAEDR